MAIDGVSPGTYDHGCFEFVEGFELVEGCNPGPHP
jgi:hypothetical protein